MTSKISKRTAAPIPFRAPAKSSAPARPPASCSARTGSGSSSTSKRPASPSRSRAHGMRVRCSARVVLPGRCRHDYGLGRAVVNGAIATRAVEVGEHLLLDAEVYGLPVGQGAVFELEAHLDGVVGVVDGV